MNGADKTDMRWTLTANHRMTTPLLFRATAVDWCHVSHVMRRPRCVCHRAAYRTQRRIKTASIYCLKPSSLRRVVRTNTASRIAVGTQQKINDKVFDGSLLGTSDFTYSRDPILSSSQRGAFEFQSSLIKLQKWHKGK